MSKRDAYVAKIKRQVDEMNLKMTELEANAKEARQDALARYDEEMAKIREHSRTAVAKLAELTAAGEDSWHKLVDDMEKMRIAFLNSFDHFKTKV